MIISVSVFMVDSSKNIRSFLSIQVSKLCIEFVFYFFLHVGGGKH